MADIGSFSPLTGVNPTLDRAAQAARSAPLDPPTVQNATAPPLNSPQAAVTQLPTTNNPEWQREANPDDQRQHSDSASENAPTREQLDTLLENINQRLAGHSTHLRFEVADDGVKWRIRIVDHETRSLVRWISWGETLMFARSLEELDARQPHRSLSGYASNPENERLGMEGGLLRVTV